MLGTEADLRVFYLGFLRVDPPLGVGRASQAERKGPAGRRVAFPETLALGEHVYPHRNKVLTDVDFVPSVTM